MRGAFNMHGSLLPKFRGRAPVNWAVLRGESSTGVFKDVEAYDIARRRWSRAIRRRAWRPRAITASR